MRCRLHGFVNFSRKSTAFRKLLRKNVSTQETTLSHQPLLTWGFSVSDDFSFPKNEFKLRACFVLAVYKYVCECETWTFHCCLYRVHMNESGSGVHVSNVFAEGAAATAGNAAAIFNCDCSRQTVHTITLVLAHSWAVMLLLWRMCALWCAHVFRLVSTFDNLSELAEVKNKNHREQPRKLHHDFTVKTQIAHTR